MASVKGRPSTSRIGIPIVAASVGARSAGVARTL
jgi:hypothetical protein